ncbi:MAG TPA: hypothetical protein VNC84_07235 [Gammaproteobacteria bacterium]|jgi:hypothetical protein|nr:hypothetical protein [Gammaproteobacteria bacterium]
MAAGRGQGSDKPKDTVPDETSVSKILKEGIERALSDPSMFEKAFPNKDALVIPLISVYLTPFQVMRQKESSIISHHKKKFLIAFLEKKRMVM